MAKWVIIFIIKISLFARVFSSEVDQAREYLKILNDKTAIRDNLIALAGWDYATDSCNKTLLKYLLVTQQIAKETREDWLKTVKVDWKIFKDFDIRRQYKEYSILNMQALTEDKFLEFTNVLTEMETLYSTAKICSYYDQNKCDLTLQPNIVEIMQNSNDTEELQHVWIGYRNAVGRNQKNTFNKYVKLMNEAAQLNNFQDAAHMWLDVYEVPNIKTQLESLIVQIKPLYLQIHAYVRFKLREKYGDIVSESGPIPAHLLGNICGHKWDSLFNLILPYPERPLLDINAKLAKKRYPPIKLFKIAESFYTSINLSTMPESFWKKSIFKKPKNKNMVCRPSSWDFADGEDYRISQCTKMEHKFILTSHHEMGHIQYYLQYKQQPTVYRTAANPGFHEAVADAFTLSINTMEHFKLLGLTTESEAHPHDIINSQFQTALSKIVQLPYGYIIDSWRWDVFMGKITEKNYNLKWWQLVHEYQGIEPPIDRSDRDFDPGCIYDVVTNNQHVTTFLSVILQYQLQKVLCIKAGKFSNDNLSSPLHECDIHGSMEAGTAIGNMMKLGSSKPWQEALESFTGQRKIDATGLLNYFQPLHKWLTNFNRDHALVAGWTSSKRTYHGND